MKKLVALAVAGAFVAPVYAADISISGETEFTYTSTTGADAAMATAESIVTVSASETINGIKVTGAVVIDQDANIVASDTDGEVKGDGSTLSLAFPNGLKLDLGDNAGAMDSVGDYSDVAPQLGGFANDGGDHAVKLTLPSFAGVTAYVSHSPKGATVIGTAPDINSYALKYGFPNGEVYYGYEEHAAENQNSYGVKYSFSGVTVAYEVGNETNGAAADTKDTGFALTYKLGDILLGMENQKTQAAGNAATVDDMVYFAEYNLGSSVDVYISTSSTDVAGRADSTVVGVEFVF